MRRPRSRRDRGEAAVAMFRCPTCGARIGEWCSIAPKVHKRRLHLVPAPQSGKRRPMSVRTVSGGAFEMNRRKH